MAEKAADLWATQPCLLCRRSKEGAHYTHFQTRQADGMQALRTMFPEGSADALNFVLFSTSGVHGTYASIEEVEWSLSHPDDEERLVRDVTFLVVHPRLVTLRYGECEPKTADDIAFLKKLRQTSWDVVATIGRADE